MNWNKIKEGIVVLCAVGWLVWVSNSIYSLHKTTDSIERKLEVLVAER